MKKQIWLQPHQARIVVACLDHAMALVDANLEELSSGKKTIRMALLYTREQIEEVRPLFGSEG